MSKKKGRKSIFDSFFEDSWFDEWEEMFKKFENIGVSGGYSITVTQTSKGTEVHVKAGEDVDVEDLRRRLEARYPGAKIFIEGGKKSREIVEIKMEEETAKKEEKKKGSDIIGEISPKRKADIKIIEEEDEEEG
ncbi:MAG: hypothetical protein QXI93_02070 [Candidatus Methanomethylicia archaeon]